jgi:hypothetical protein
VFHCMLVYMHAADYIYAHYIHFRSSSAPTGLGLMAADKYSCMLCRCYVYIYVYVYFHVYFWYTLHIDIHSCMLCIYCMRGHYLYALYACMFVCLLTSSTITYSDSTPGVHTCAYICTWVQKNSPNFGSWAKPPTLA